MTEAPRPPGGDPPKEPPPDPTVILPSDPTSAPPPPPSPPPSAPSSPPPSAPSSPAPPSTPSSPPPPQYSPPSGAPGYPPPGVEPYPPPAGYPAAGYGTPPPPGYPSNEDRTWALVAHFGGAAGAFFSGGPLGFVGPLIAYVAKGQQSPTARAHAVAALNFQLLWSIIAVVAFCVGWILLFVPTLVVTAIQVIFGVIAGVKASNGELYRYPMSGSFIK
jgi:uncharacterized protein